MDGIILIGWYSKWEGDHDQHANELARLRAEREQEERRQAALAALTERAECDD